MKNNTSLVKQASTYFNFFLQHLLGVQPMFVLRCSLQVLSSSRGSLHCHPNKMVSSVATLYCLPHCRMEVGMSTICLQLRLHITLKVCESLIISVEIITLGFNICDRLSIIHPFAVFCRKWDFYTNRKLISR